MKTYKIVICGGHLSPALAIIERLKRRKKYQLFYIGRKHSLEGDKSLSLEYQVINKLDVPFYPLVCGRLQRSFTIYTIPSLLKFPLSLLQSLIFLLNIKPKVVISFGGYVSLPVCLVAYFLRIPIIIHEQTNTLGLTNRIVAQLAKVICLSWKDTKNVPKGKVLVLTGNPIRQSLFQFKENNLTNFGDRHLPLLYVTGGSLGSESINKLIGNTLSYLAKHFRIIHQCGSAFDKKDLLDLLKQKNSLPVDLQKNYTVLEKIDPDMVGSIYQKAQLIVSRSGANTVSEIAAVGVPTIFIPLPWAAYGEQERNALMLKKAGIAEVLMQNQLTSEIFINMIHKMMKNLSLYQRNAQKIKELMPSNSAAAIIRLIEPYLQ